MRLEDITLRFTFDVVAYDCAGYGDDRSRTFTDGDLAMAYAKSLSANFDARVIKRITMDPITQVIWSAQSKD
jgi:hypothetical protein